MRRKSLVSLIVTVVLAGFAFASTFIWNKRPLLGLDLQGGASVTMTAKGKFSAGALDTAKSIIRNRVDGLGVAEPEIVRQGDAIVVNLPGVKDQKRALEVVGRTAELRFRPVLASVPYDLTTAASTSTATTTAGVTTVPGATTVAGATTVPGATTTASATTASAGTTPVTTAAAAGPGGAVPPRRQVSSTTTAAATTTSAGSTTSSGTTSPATTSSATTASGTTTPGTTTPGGTTPATTAPVDTTPTTAGPPPTYTSADNDVPTATVILPYRAMDKGATTASYQLGPTALDGKDISTADAVLSQQTNEWEVTLTLTDGGLKKWNTLAADCFSGKSATCPPFGSSTSTTASGSGAVAIVLDSVVISSPVFQTGNFTDNRIQITGGGTGFKEADARNLALILKYGALPVPLEAQAVQTVSATLGKDSLRAGVIAGVVGLLLVFTLMLLYYRALAAVVLVGLCVSASILWFLISWQGAVLTLSGATGVIVSIGVTVDSYVVFFERLKDDVRSGKTLRSSAQRGFASAWRTILAADTVSLIGALLLFWLTVGSVRGFAYYLGLSTLIDIFVAYFFTRPAVRLLSQSKFFSGDKVLGVRKGEAVVGSAQ